MRRLTILIATAMLIAPLPAEIAQLYTPMVPGFTTQAGTFFSPDALEGLSDEIPTGRLPELPEGRTLALTRRAFEDLGDSDGVASVDTEIVKEGTIRESDGQTGWYSFDLGLYSPEDAYALYNTLSANGLRPYAEIENEDVRITVRHVLAFRLEDAISRLRASGIADAKPEMEANPYTS